MLQVIGIEAMIERKRRESKEAGSQCFELVYRPELEHVVCNLPARILQSAKSLGSVEKDDLGTLGES